MSEGDALTAIVVMLGAWLFWPLILAAVVIVGFAVVSLGIMLYALAADAWTAMRRRLVARRARR